MGLGLRGQIHFLYPLSSYWTPSHRGNFFHGKKLFPRQVRLSGKTRDLSLMENEGSSQSRGKVLNLWCSNSIIATLLWSKGIMTRSWSSLGQVAQEHWSVLEVRFWQSDQQPHPAAVRDVAAGPVWFRLLQEQKQRSLFPFMLETIWMEPFPTFPG